VTRPKVVCLCPVKNEAWILDRYLRCAATWADHIVVADQGSDDGSDEIAAAHPKVRLVRNPDPKYDEGARQRLLLAAARELVPGPRVLLALDADEMLTADRAESPEWATALAAPPGTVLRFQWVNIWPDLETCWVPDEDIPFGFVDDGSDHTGSAIHSRRLPVPPGAPSVVFRRVKVLHYQYTEWDRMASKQRWYQCWERLTYPSKRAAGIFRQYNFMHAVRAADRRPLAPEWLAGYERAGIDMTSVRKDPEYRWDRQVLEMFRTHGPRTFRKLDVWDPDWAALAGRLGVEPPAGGFGDPRGPVARALHRWLRATQGRHHRYPTRGLQWLLRFVGW